MAAAGFDALVTNDRGLEYEQNLNSLPGAVVLVLAPANTIESLRPAFPALLEALAILRPRRFIKIAVP